MKQLILLLLTIIAFSHCSKQQDYLYTPFVGDWEPVPRLMQNYQRVEIPSLDTVRVYYSDTHHYTNYNITRERGVLVYTSDSLCCELTLHPLGRRTVDGRYRYQLQLHGMSLNKPVRGYYTKLLK